MQRLGPYPVPTWALGAPPAAPQLMQHSVPFSGCTQWTAQHPLPWLGFALTRSSTRCSGISHLAAFLPCVLHTQLQARLNIEILTSEEQRYRSLKGCPYRKFLFVWRIPDPAAGFIQENAAQKNFLKKISVVTSVCCSAGAAWPLPGSIPWDSALQGRAPFLVPRSHESFMTTSFPFPWTHKFNL